MAHPLLYTAPARPPYAAPYVLPPAAFIPTARLGRLGRGLGTTTITTTGGTAAFALIGVGVLGAVIGGTLVAYAGATLFR